MANKQLELIIKEQSIAGENANQLIAAFGAPFTEAGEILQSYETIKVTDKSQTQLMREAREKRLALKKIRTGVENKRKELKEGYVKAGRAIDSVARFVKETIQPAEEYLELQEKFVEIQEAKEAADRKARRIEQLSPYGVDPSMYNLDTMDDNQFDTLLVELKAKEEARIAEEKAIAKAAEEARLAKEAEDKRIREENEKLRAKAEEERKKREAIEQEQRDKAAAEAKAKAEAEEREHQALLAPDKDKLMQFAEALDIIRTTKLPAVKSDAAQQVVNSINSSLAELKASIEASASRL